MARQGVLLSQVWKRTFSAIMAVAMILGLLPTQMYTSANAADVQISSVTKLNYNFVKLWSGNAETEGTDISSITAFEQTKSGGSQEINASNGIQSDAWMYGGSGSGATFSFYNKQNGIKLSGENGAWGAIKINVPTAGTYRPFANISALSTGGAVKIYLAPASDPNPRDEKYAIGAVTTYNKTDVPDNRYDLNVLNLEVGDYIISYERVASSYDKSGKDFATSAFTLEPFTSLYYNFHKPWRPDSEYGQWPLLLTFDSYETTTRGSTSEKNPGFYKSGAFVSTDPWMYFAASRPSLKHDTGSFLYQDPTYGTCVRDQTGDFGAIKIKVPVAGLYTPVFDGSFWDGGGNAKIFIAPVSASNPRDSKYSIGNIDTYAAKAEWRKQIMLKPVLLEAGEYTVFYELLQKNPACSWNRFGMAGLKLEKNTDPLYIAASFPSGIAIGEEKSAEILTFENGLSSSIDNASERTASVTDPDIASVRIAKDEKDGKWKLFVLGNKAGQTSIQVKVTMNDKTANMTVPISITKPRGLIYDLNKLYIGSPDWNSAVDINTVVDFAMTTMGDPKEINRDKGVYTDPWIYMGGGAAGRIQFEDGAYACALIGEPGAWGQLKIRVPESRVYQVVSINGFWENGTNMNVYLTPDKPGLDVKDGTYLLGSIDTNSPTREWKKETSLRNVYLEKGDYLVTYQRTSQTPERIEMKGLIGGIKLDSPDARELNIRSHTVNTMAVNHSVSTELFADINGTAVDISSASEISVKSADDKIANAVIRNDTNQKKIFVDINARALGSTKVTVTATVNSITGSYVIPVEVKEENILVRADLTAPKTILQSGESIQSELKAFTADGTAVNASNATVYYKSSNLEVANVDQNGLIKAGKCGSAEIIVFVKKDDILMQRNMYINVTDNSDITSIEIDGTLSSAIGTNVQLKTIGVRASGYKTPLDAANVTYELISSVPSGAIEVSTSGRVSSKAIGTAQIKATASINGKNIISTPVEFKVTQGIPTDFEIDFKKYNGESTPPRKVVYDSNHEWQINKEKTSPLLTSADGYMVWQEFGLAVWMNTDEYTGPENMKYLTAIDFKVPGTGTYTLSLSGPEAPAGTLADVYIDNKYMGRMDWKGDKYIKQGDEKVFNSIELTEGIHQITFHRLRRDNDHRLLPIGSMKFKLENEPVKLKEVIASLKSSILSVGESTQFSGQVMMTNGRPMFFGDLITGPDTENNLVITNKTPDIISLTNNKVVALKAGKGTIEVVAKINGVTYNKTCDITVDNDKLTSVIATIDQPKVSAGDTIKFKVAAKTASGREINPDDVTFTYQTSNNQVVSVDKNIITAVAEGNANLTVSATMSGATVNTIVPITVQQSEFVSIEVIANRTIMKLEDKDVKIAVKGYNGAKKEISLEGAKITYTSDNESVLKVNNTGEIAPANYGTAKVTVSVVLKEITLNKDIELTVSPDKTQSTYYTAEMIEAARENVKKYDWAKKEKDFAVTTAEKYVGKEETLWNLVTTQEVPRGIIVGYRFDPNGYSCRYCGTDLRAKYGQYPWLFNAMTTPYKIQCPDCRRKFPSNDYERFHELGIDEHGNFRYELAKERNAQLVADGKNGYLKNILYPEMDEKLGVKDWGVDDSYGYKTGKTITGTNNVKQEETHTYIGYYNHWAVWHNSGVKGVVSDALDSLREAYIYTGDAKYGRVGAILVDRIADVYPEMKLKPYLPRFSNSDSSILCGRIIGCIWETGIANQFIWSYDAFYPMYEDSQVINFLSDKAQKYKFENPKKSAKDIRRNVEDGILREVGKAVKARDIWGNFGFHQATMTYAAVVLDSPKDTRDMIEWVFQSGEEIGAPNYAVTGGNVLAQLVNNVSRDGIGGEASPGYNGIWVTHPMNLAEALKRYGKYPEYDLFKNPKYVKMFYAMAPLTTTRNTTVCVGDTGNTGTTVLDFIYPSQALKGYQYTKDPRIAQIVYMLNKGNVSKLHYDIFTKDPESAQTEIKDVINTYGEWDLDRSDQLPAYGFSILRSGDYYPSVGMNAAVNTMQDFWMYYGTGRVHGHPDALNLGIEAYGLNMAPELGYPVACDGSDPHVNWTLTTINHNTVAVNDMKQTTIDKNGSSMHFDDAGQVKVMDVDAAKAYGSTSIYRRTVVMVKANDDVSYGVDFFRVRGGNEHVYSFHSQSDEIFETEGLNLVKQPMGSYAGPDIPWKTLGVSNGYSYLYNVRRAQQPGSGEFAVDFKVKDFRKVLPKTEDLHLRISMLNDFNMSEVAIANGDPPAVAGNPKTLEFLLARRSGKDLDSLFTTVIEPYKEKRYIAKMEQIPAVRIGGATQGGTDTVKAVKVTLSDGREDYIVYATNNKVIYRVDDLFNFSGFIGVYTAKNENMIYSYMNDGEQIGDIKGTAAYTGSIADFTKELTMQNEIVIKSNEQIDIDRLAGKFIYIKNDGAENAAYQIHGARMLDNGNIALDIGDSTCIRRYVNSNDIYGGYIYNIAEGQSFRIPLPTSQDTTPIFTPIQKMRAEVGSELKFHVSAVSPSGRALTYSAKSLPRGAQFDPKTQTFTWTPDNGLLGKNHASFNVTDGDLTATQYVEIEVFGSSKSGGNDKIVIVDPPPKGENGDKPPVDTIKTVKDSKEFNIDKEKTVTVDTKLGSVIIPEGSFEKNGKGKLSIETKDSEVKLSLQVDGKDIAAKEPIKASIPYQPNESMKDTNCIIIRDEHGTIVPSGIFENGKMNFFANTLGKFTIGYNEKVFDDLTNHAWASDAIIRLAARGIINGTSMSSYAPAKNITRADFISLVVRALGLHADTTDNFSDVSTNDYYAKEVGIAKTLGVVTGQGDNKVNPKSQISREDMMVIVARALPKAGYMLKNGEISEFTDASKIADYATDSVHALVANGIVAGSSGKINPKGKTTRAEVAVLLDRIVLMAR